jgi:predicted nucleic acid-binding protein
MTNGVFFDTNIFIYLFVGDPIKADIAESLIRRRGMISVQVLNEFISVTRGKYRFGWDKVKESLAAIREECIIIPLDIAVHEHAIEICQKSKLSIYDSLIAAAALTAGCDTLYSEDMNHGQKIGSLRIINPFRSI